MGHSQAVRQSFFDPSYLDLKEQPIEDVSMDMDELMGEQMTGDPIMKEGLPNLSEAYPGYELPLLKSSVYSTNRIT